jgi:WD40 repeat protein
VRCFLLRWVLAIILVGTGRAEEPLPPGATLRIGAGPMRLDYAASTTVLSPDGKFVAANAGGGSSFYVFNAETAERVLHERLDAIHEVGFSRDSKQLHLLSMQAQRKLVWKRWNVADWSALPDGELEASANPRRPFDLEMGMRLRWQRSTASPDENWIVDIASGKPALTLPRTDFFNAHYSEDGSIAVIHAASDMFKKGGLQVWNLKRLELLYDLPDVHPTIFAVSADGQRMVTSNVQISNLHMNSVVLWDLKTGKRLQEVFEKFSTHRMELAPRGDRLYLCGTKVVNEPPRSYFCDLTEDAKPPRESPIGDGSGESISFSDDGDVLALTHANGIKIWDWKAGKFRFDGEAAPPGPIQSLATSHDQRIVAVNSPKQITLWDVKTKKSVAAFNAPSQGLVHLSGDGNYVAITRAHWPALVWSRAEPKTPLAFPAEIDNKFVATTRLDGGGLARGQADGLIELAGFEGGGELAKQPFHHCRGHLGAITGLAYSTDGLGLISRGADHTVRVWDAMTGKPINQFENAAWGDSFVALSANNGFAAWLEEDKLHLYRVSDGKPIGPVPNVRHAGFSMRGAKLVVCGNDYVALIDLETGKLTKRYEAGKKSLHSVTFAPDDKRVYVSDREGQVTVLNSETLERLKQLDPRFTGDVLRFSVDGKRLVLATPLKFVVWDLENDRVQSEISSRGAVAFAHVNDGKRERIAMLTALGTRSSVDAKTGERIGGDWSSRDTRELGDCVFTSRGELISTTPGGARIWNLKTGENVDNLVDSMFYGYAAALSADERLIALGGEGISIWDLPKRKLVLRIDAGPAAFPGPNLPRTVAVGFSPDARRVAAIDGYVRIFDSKTGRQRASNEGTVDAAQRRPQARPAFEASRQPLTFSRDNRLLVVTSQIGRTSPKNRYEVLFLDTLTGRAAYRLEQAPHTTSCALLVDDATLLTGDREGQILFWDVPKLLEAAFPPQQLTADEAWAKLDDLDPSIAWQAVSTLSASPKVARAKVQSWLDEKPELTAAQLDDILPGLRSSTETERAIALANLLRAGDAIDSRLEALLKADLPADVQAVIAAVSHGVPLADQPDMLRPARVVQLLERIGDVSSQTLLKRLASGRSWKLAKEEAHSALARLKP